MKLIETTCKRCGRPIMTAEKSITGAHKLKMEFDRICSRCITPDEREEINRGLLQQVHQNYR